MNRRGKL